MGTFLAEIITNVSEITKPKIDAISILLSTIGFGGIIFGLSAMAETAFSTPKVWGPLLLGIVALVLFGLRQMKMDQPIVNLRVFKYPMFTIGTAIMFLGILIFLSTAILLPMYLKGALLFSAAMAGLILLPGNAINFIMSPIVGTLFDKFGARRFVITGFVFVILGNIMFLSTLSATTTTWQVIVAFMLFFFGITMVMMPSQTNGLNQLPHELYRDGSAAMNTLNQVAGAAGTAIAITVFTAGQTGYLVDFPNATQPEVLAAGVKYAFYFTTGISIVGFILALLTRKPSLVKANSTVAVKAARAVRE